jgi:large subunit ribosomal protein L21
MALFLSVELQVKVKPMFAVIKTGGKQYVVKEGDTFSVEKLELPAGQKFLFDQVLLVDDGSNTAIGTPRLETAVVLAEVVKNYKDEKILVFKKKRRKQYRRTRGHRQNLTQVKIGKIIPDRTMVPADDLKFEAVSVELIVPAPAPKPAAKPKGPKPAKPAEKAETKPTAKSAKSKPKPAPAPAKKKAAAKPQPRSKKTAK